MLSTKLKEAAGNSADATLYVDDVFSTYLYTGNGSTQTITNGIDLAGKGGLVWIKARSAANGHWLFDTSRGANYNIQSNNTNASGLISNTLNSFDSTGFSLGSVGINGSGVTHASWTFREAAKFFDVVTYTGTGSAQNISHALGGIPGCIIFKRTSSPSNWTVYHRSVGNGSNLLLNTTDASSVDSTVFNNTSPTSSVFTVGTSALTNANGSTYVAYLYAHDTAADGIIQCGSYTGNGAASNPITLGYEPQWILLKRTDITGDWGIIDTMRGWSYNTEGVLKPNTSSVEDMGNSEGYPTATGFDIGNGNYNINTRSYIYIAIRRPNKPPTSGTQVYNAIARTGTGAAATVTGVGFAPDFMMDKDRSVVANNFVFDRLRGSNQRILPNLTYAEVTDTGNQLVSFDMNGVSLSTGGAVNTSGGTFINWFFKRAPGFFDVVCYTGTGVAGTVAHNLAVVPELIIIKNRNTVSNWIVGCNQLTKITETPFMLLNDTNSKLENNTYFDSGINTDATFRVGVNLSVNGAAGNIVAYLFATLAGISKVGSYTGNGTSQNIDCGFATGARFFLVKATSTTGSWWVWDSARGITAGNDPALQLNSTAAEITTADAVDPYSPGITVNQEATCSINANGVSYIFLAVA